MLTLSRIAVLVALGVGLALAGCGDDDESGSASPPPPPPPAQTSAASGDAQKLELSADPGGALKYDKTELKAGAGTVQIVMDNPSDVPHNVGIEGAGVDVQGPVVEKGGMSEVSADLKAGEYEFYCSVGSHRQAGMKGTLTVR